ncbi:MAG: riboflavin synthase [Planctomycetota bacterium]
MAVPAAQDFVQPFQFSFRNLHLQTAMFTGLVEEKGTIEMITPLADAADLKISCNIVHEDVAIGDSIAVNGCCLTVVAIEANKLTFQAGSETLSRTNLGKLNEGSPVNLERSLSVGSRLGGHFVTGHVDAVGVVDQRDDHGEWSDIWFKVDAGLTRQMAGKGSVAVDGISLTLVKVEADRFSIQAIPHTLAETTLGERSVGDQVNIETDLLAKYVQQQLNSG